MSKILEKHIEILKNEIQLILDKLNTDKVVENIEFLKKQKEAKIEELKKVHESFNYELDRESMSKRENEYKKACAATDTLEFYRLKNKSNRNELLTVFKKNREKAREDFEKFNKVEKEYSALDSNKVPGFLFFSKEVINAYKLCPYIHIEDGFENKRKVWLENAPDKGVLYYNLYDIVINEREYNNKKVEEEALDAYFEGVHDIVLSDEQKEVLSCTIVYLEDYLVCSVKTKKMKEKFKLIINNISLLVTQTGFPLNDYISLKYNTLIPVNYVDSKPVHETMFVIKEYTENLKSYSKVKEDITQSKKYIKNVTQNLKQEMFEYLMDNKLKIEKQVPKYVDRKWSQLSLEERIERFESFASYYVSKFLVSTNLISSSEKESRTADLNMLIKNADVKYKELKWSVKGGIIEKISILKWNDVSKKLSIERCDKKVKEKDLGGKRTCETKSVINKKTEKIINEEVLKILILNKDSGEEQNLKASKETIIEDLKIKLCLKRISANDKAYIMRVYDEIYSIMCEN